jgi:hypothetical protein
MHLYLPALFKLWEAFNSSVIDDRLLELAGDLSEEHVSGTSGSAGEVDGAHWKDVGLWTESQWNFLVGKGLGSMSKSDYLIRSFTYLTNRIPRRCSCGGNSGIPLSS